MAMETNITDQATEKAIQAAVSRLVGVGGIAEMSAHATARCADLRLLLLVAQLSAEPAEAEPTEGAHGRISQNPTCAAVF